MPIKPDSAEAARTDKRATSSISGCEKASNAINKLIVNPIPHRKEIANK